MYLDQAETKFIERMSQQLPGLDRNFDAALRVPANRRYKWGQGQLRTVFRDGWFVNAPVKLEDAETVRAHVDDLCLLIRQFFPGSIQRKCLAMARVHDVVESIANARINGVPRDLNPKFNQASYELSEEEKHEIELLAMRVLSESRPEKLVLWCEYERGETEAAALVKALDKLQVMFSCVRYVESGLYSFPAFHKYWDHWNPERIQQEMPQLVVDIYTHELVPRIEEIRV